MKIRDRIVELRRVPAKELQPNPLNWRGHPRDQTDALRGVLQEIGYAGALIARQTSSGGLELIDGHLRRDISGDDEVPVLVLDVDEDEAKKLLATIDPLSAMAEAQEDALKRLAAEIQFESDDLNQLVADLAGLDAEPTEGLTEADDVPDVPEEPTTKPSDLWILGEHRLLCGDATSPDDVDRLMDGEKASLVATDPPYLVDYTGERPNDSGKDWTDSYREIDIKDADAFFRRVFENVIRAVAPKAAIYTWHAHKRTGVIQRVWEELGIVDHQQIIWVKPSPVFGRVYWHFRHEPCMMGWVKGSMPEHDGRHEFNSIWEVDWEGKARVVGNEHPMQKPVELFTRPMQKHTKKGDVCFEPFSGSGSQILAAERLERRCFAMEIEPRFVDVAVRRWEKFTGRKAKVV